MPKQLSEAQAWVEVARRVAYAVPRRCTDWHEGTTTCFQCVCLCYRLDDLRLLEDAIPFDVWQRMTARIERYLGYAAFAYDDVGENYERGGRVLAALWMAEDAKHGVEP